MSGKITLSSEFQIFFDGIDRQELRFPRCDTCRRFHWYPMKRCPHCGGSSLSWERVSGDGVVHSWTKVEHAFDEAFSSRVPYTILLVSFQDAPGVRLIGPLLGDGVVPECGSKVRVEFLPGTAGPAMVGFKRA